MITNSGFYTLLRITAFHEFEFRHFCKRIGAVSFAHRAETYCFKTEIISFQFLFLFCLLWFFQQLLLYPRNGFL